MARNTTLQILLLLLLCCAIAVFPLLTISGSEFGGTDGKAVDAIAQNNPSYIPWFESILEPPGTETESLLFALQAALGASVLAFGFGYYWARKRYANQMI